LFFVAGAIYGVFIDGTFWKIYFALVALYLCFVLMNTTKENTKRKNIMISTWSESDDPTSYVTNEIVMDKVIAHAKQLNEDQKDVHITATHIMGHALAWSIYKQRRDIGRISWGSFKRSKKLGVTVLVDI